MSQTENLVMNELIYEALEKYSWLTGRDYFHYFDQEPSDDILTYVISKFPGGKVAFYVAKAIHKLLPSIKVKETICFPPHLRKTREIVSINIYRDIRKFLRPRYLDFATTPDYEKLGEEIRKEIFSLINRRWKDQYSQWIDWEEFNKQDPKIKYGTIEWFDQSKGFGVINSSSGQHFVHKNNVICKVSKLSERKEVAFYSRPRHKKDGLEAYNVNLFPEKVTFPQILDYPVVGFSHGGRQDVIALLELGDILVLRREPQNPYDSNAIRVDVTTGTIVGYLDKYVASSLKSKFDKYNRPITGFVTSKSAGSRGGYASVSVIFPICEFRTEEEIRAFDHLNCIEDEFEKPNVSQHPSQPVETLSENGTNAAVDGSTASSDTSYWFNSWGAPKTQATSQNISTASFTNQEQETKVVGVTYEGRQNVVRTLSVGEEVLLEREPSNPYDRNAIKVMRKNGDQIGYIARDLAARIAPEIDNYGSALPARISALPTGYSVDSSYGVRIKFSIPQENLDDDLDF